MDIGPEITPCPRRQSDHGSRLRRRARSRGGRPRAAVGRDDGRHVVLPPAVQGQLDPRLARHAVRNILKALQQADPAHASGYATNATRYLGRLEQLDLELEQALAPLRGAAMVTYHDAFAYFARHYGLKVVGVIEPVPDIEPSLKHLAFVYRAARANQVQAIFTEPPTPSRLARQIGSDLHLPLAELDTLETGSLTPVAYEESIRSNLRVLLKTIKPDAQRNPS